MRNIIKTEIKPGWTQYYLNDVLHNDNGEPAVIMPNGDRFWYVAGVLHRKDDLPAVEYANGINQWFWCGKCHRDNWLPAITRPVKMKDDTVLTRIIGFISSKNSYYINGNLQLGMYCKIRRWLRSMK